MQETSLFDSYGAPTLRQLVFSNKNLDAAAEFNCETGLDAEDALASPQIDGISTNLSAFHARTGRFDTAQGWAEPLDAATWPMRYLEGIVGVTSKETADEFMRLFMIPGGGHCVANEVYARVPADYHVPDTLMEWVERGTISDGGVLSSRPSDGKNTARRLCLWPSHAVFDGEDEDEL